MYEKVWNNNKISFGGDYNPEQWDEEIWKEDMRLFKLAHIDTVTLNVFSWAALQPSENEYNFSKLDKIMEMVKENGLKVVLATSTAAHPAWMAKRYPEILRTEFNGMKRKFGGRHNSCTNSRIYRKYSVRLAEKLAERYKDYDNIIAWHISNEYGGECYCDNCEKAFQVWLKEKYKTIDELNRVWNTSFWGHTFYDWDKVICTPILYMVKTGVDEKLRSFVKNGGTLVTSFFSGYVDEHDLVTVGGYPGKLRDILGIWVEESDALPEGKKNSFIWDDVTYDSELLCDLLHSEGADVLTVYEQDFYKGMPVLTKNVFGKGQAYYVATRSTPAFYKKLIEKVCAENKVSPVMDTPDGVEATARYNENNKYVFLLNHSEDDREIVADADYYDILNDTQIKSGDKLKL